MTQERRVTLFLPPSGQGHIESLVDELQRQEPQLTPLEQLELLKEVRTYDAEIMTLEGKEYIERQISALSTFCGLPKIEETSQ